MQQSLRVMTLTVAAGIGTVALNSSAQMPPQPDAQMQMVLDQHAALGPKPLETLSPAEARKQPSRADAVRPC